MTICVYAGVGNCKFSEFDDTHYVVNNRYVTGGFTVPNVWWSVTNVHLAYWWPATWWSHTLAYKLWGRNAGGHHVANLMLHAANVLLLFYLLKRMTGSFWPSAFAAALFAVHPLAVESVAWVAERGNVLSMFFLLWTLLAYHGYVRNESKERYILVAVLTGLALMSKPMVVTLPFVLLLLDYWPLGRFGGITLDRLCRRDIWRRLMVEKIPLFVLAAIACGLLIIFQVCQKPLFIALPIPLLVRLENAVVSYVIYLEKMIWPVNLAVFYPHPGSTIEIWKVIAAGMILACITIIVFRTASKVPALLTGWLWYVGTLVPMSGLIQTASHPRADRYMYLPMIGLCMAIGWAGQYVWEKRYFSRMGLGIVAAAWLAVLIPVSRNQVLHWQDDPHIFKHAVEVTSRNWLAHYNLASALCDEGKTDAAIHHFSEAVRYFPRFADAHYNLGVLMGAKGRIAEAKDYYRKAIQYNPLCLSD